jgi:excisionase family DNA binding protein
MGGEMETYLTASEVAVMLRLSLQTIRRKTMKKEIPFHKICRAVRYKKSEIEQWVERGAALSGKGLCEKTESGLFDTADGGAEA